ncbi:hypothetical protein ACFQZT_19675 [Paenibacillus sp. GCM10027628]|uniref:hypothetical protein n=1 Tax=Paenibacillus sp. GCM10027628 TaxID=3273413 RepID=UPI00363875E9
MKPTLELQEIITALGIDPKRYQAWKQKELQDAQNRKLINELTETTTLYEMVV